MDNETLRKELEQAQSDNTVLINLLDKTNNQVFTFYHISRTIASTHDFPEMINQIFAVIGKSISFERASLYLLDEDRKVLHMQYSLGLPEGHPQTINVGEGLPGRIAEHGEHSHIHDLSIFYDTFNDFIHSPGETPHQGAYIGIALKSKESTIGVVGIESSRTYGLTVDDMDFMAMISHQIAAGIAKSHLFTKTEQLSRLDGLTGLFNRRIFQTTIEQELQRRTRTHAPLSLIMLDIDHFKQFNDNFGHQAGDSVLQELGHVIQEQCRHTTVDSCFRYGGEEFAIVLPGLDSTNALRVAERIRHAIAGHRFTVIKDHPGRSVTVSLGVATTNGDCDPTSEQLIRQADKALYASKQNGRNRVTLHEVTR